MVVAGRAHRARERPGARCFYEAKSGDGQNEEYQQHGGLTERFLMGVMSLSFLSFAVKERGYPKRLNTAVRRSFLSLVVSVSTAGTTPGRMVGGCGAGPDGAAELPPPPQADSKRSAGRSLSHPRETRRRHGQQSDPCAHARATQKRVSHSINVFNVESLRFLVAGRVAHNAKTWRTDAGERCVPLQRGVHIQRPERCARYDQPIAVSVVGTAYLFPAGR